MTAWDRVNRLERDLAIANARLVQERELNDSRTHDKLRHAVARIDELLAERDRARAAAIALEQELDLLYLVVAETADDRDELEAMLAEMMTDGVDVGPEVER